MAEVADLDIAKADRAKDCGEVTPEQMLKVALRNLQQDNRKCVRAYLAVYFVANADDPLCPEEMETYRSNMTRAEEVAYIDLCWDHAMHEWGNP